MLLMQTILFVVCDAEGCDDEQRIEKETVVVTYRRNSSSRDYHLCEACALRLRNGEDIKMKDRQRAKV